MKNLFIVANWKSNKTAIEAKNWLQEELRIMNPVRQGFDGELSRTAQGKQIPNTENKEIIVCPPFTLLSNLKSEILSHKSSIRIGAQDVSPFDKGAHTGEVNAKQIKEFAEFVIIGHSERRQQLKEDDELIFKKVEMAKKYNLKVIFCIQNKQTPIPEGISMVAYEPMFAIGTGNPDTPENAVGVSKAIRSKHPFIKYVLYGGSVTSQNVNSFTRMPELDGVLVGKASLDENEFLEIIRHA